MSSIESEPSSGIVYLGLAEAATPLATLVAAGRVKDDCAVCSDIPPPIGEVSTLGKEEVSFFSSVVFVSVNAERLVEVGVSALKAALFACSLVAPIPLSRVGVEEKLGVTGLRIVEKSSSGNCLSVVPRSTVRAGGVVVLS